MLNFETIYFYLLKLNWLSRIKLKFSWAAFLANQDSKKQYCYLKFATRNTQA